jgi:hypothetical protein
MGARALALRRAGVSPIFAPSGLPDLPVAGLGRSIGKPAMPLAIAYTSWVWPRSRQPLRRSAKPRASLITQTFVEVETGKGHDALERRPQLRAALAAARKAKCHVVVSKLDRLARNVHFISRTANH